MIRFRSIRRSLQPCSRCYSRPFYNDEYRPHHPFENTVQFKFEKYTPSEEEFHSFFKGFDRKISATELWYNDQTAFINFRDAKTKAEIISSDLLFDIPYPHSVHDYSKVNDFTRDPTDVRLPFNASILASFRPSVHSVSLIRKRLYKYGYMNGSEIVKCPYDNDRAFLYCNFQQKKSVTAAFLSESIMPGYAVGQDSVFCSNVLENVEIMQNHFNEYRRFLVYVNVMFDGLPSDGLNQEITSFLEQFGEIDMMDTAEYSPSWKQSLLRVKFKYPISVYRMFYNRTMFGRVCETLPVSGAEIRMLIPQTALSMITKHLNTVELNGVVLGEDEDVFEFCSNLLDAAGCNPGIISGVFVPRDKKIFIKVLHHWYVKDVSERLAQFLYFEKSKRNKSKYRHMSVVEKNRFWNNSRRPVKDAHRNTFV